MKTAKLRVTGLCVGNSPEAGEFPAQMVSNAEKVSIWWRHRALLQVKQPRWLKVNRSHKSVRNTYTVHYNRGKTVSCAYIIGYIDGPYTGVPFY